jgi:hypothetical protein
MAASMGSTGRTLTSLPEAGRKHGLNRERVHQIKKKALSKVRASDKARDVWRGPGVGQKVNKHAPQNVPHNGRVTISSYHELITLRGGREMMGLSLIVGTAATVAANPVLAGCASVLLEAMHSDPAIAPTDCRRKRKARATVPEEAGSPRPILRALGADIGIG